MSGLCVSLVDFVVCLILMELRTHVEVVGFHWISSESPGSPQMNFSIPFVILVRYLIPRP